MLTTDVHAICYRRLDDVLETARAELDMASENAVRECGIDPMIVHTIHAALAMTNIALVHLRSHQVPGSNAYSEELPCLGSIPTVTATVAGTGRA